MNTKNTCNLEYNKFKSVTIEDEKLVISGVPIMHFKFPEEFNCKDVAWMLANEDTEDLRQIFGCLKKLLNNDCRKFAFTLKS